MCVYQDLLKADPQPPLHMSGGLSTLMHSHLSGVVVNEIGIGSLLATEFVAGSRSHDHEKGSGSGSLVFSCVISLFLFCFLCFCFLFLLSFAEL